ncbi:MAG: IS110 family transposase [Desulfobacterales bacterium]|nr:IS110 family transposase [Desulfobacterales bacterium]MDJ0989263.1 IS110 family transposase [Desulfobacterales bacterium]
MKNHITIGVDLGDRHHIAVVLDPNGNQLEATKLINTKVALKRFFQPYDGATVAIEAGTHSPWISRLLESLGCTVYVGNPRKLRVIWDCTDKSDLRDARMLAMIARLEPKLLWPIRHRDINAHNDLEVIKAREMLVQSRSKLINHVRSAIKGIGQRLPKCSAASFANKASGQIPSALQPALIPLLETIAQITDKIRALDKRINVLALERYPHTHWLQQVQGVGPVTALTFVLTIEDPARFAKSRMLGPYLGLTPRRDQSGQTEKQLPITKAGNALLRKLLVNCAHYIIGPFGADSDLRRHGLAIAARGGKNARKRAAVAVARKLAVLLHQLWVSEQNYVPLHSRINLGKAA